MLKTCDTFFQDSLMNKKLKNNIYLKYNFCNNIAYTTVQKLEVSIFFLIEISFYSARIC